MKTGEIVERLIRVKDGLSSRVDRDATNDAVNHLYEIDLRVQEMNAELTSEVREMLKLKGAI